MAIPDGLIRSFSDSAVKTAVKTAFADGATDIEALDLGSWPTASNGRYAAALLNRGGANEEVIWYSPKSGNTMKNVVRGRVGQAFAHSAGESIEHVYTALDAAEANAHVTDITRDDHKQLVHISNPRTITASHTWAGNNVHTGTTSFDGDVVATGDVNVQDFHADTIYGDVDITGDVSFTASPTMPMGGTPASLDGTAVAGTSVKPAREDHKHGWSATALIRAIFPAGVIVEYGGASAPSTEWKICDGSAVSRTTYAALFTAIGTTHGAGDGSTTFNLPDLRDRVVTGVGSSHTLGQKAGALTKTLSTSEIPSHNHTATQGAHGHTLPSGHQYLQTSPTAEANQINTAGGAGNINVTYGDTPPASPAITVGNTGGGSGFNIEQPWIGLNYIIKAH